MKIKNANSTSCKKCLQISLSLEMMIRFAQLVNPNYDIYQRMGIKPGIPIPNDAAAERIVIDMIRDDLYVEFVEALIRIETEGYMARRYNLQGLNNVVAGIVAEGYSFDRVTGQFFENQQQRISPSWGRLHEGDIRKMAVLRLDIVGNSTLVRNNPQAKLKKTYDDIRNIVYKAAVSRIGRLWSWEGDGGLAVFLIGPIERNAVYAGMEILHELYFYNRLHNQLDGSINVRISTHIGQVQYSDSELERLKNDTVKQAMALEGMASPNTLSVSYNLYMAMDPVISNLFSSEKTGRGLKYRLYTIRTEK